MHSPCQQSEPEAGAEVKDVAVVYKLETKDDGMGVITGVADRGVEVLLLTTHQSPIQFSSIGVDCCSYSGKKPSKSIYFHTGWPGVPQGFHAAANQMTLGETSLFQMDAADLKGDNGDFADILEGLNSDDAATVRIELELRERAEVVNVPHPLDKSGNGLLARFWVRLKAGTFARRPVDFSHVRLHLNIHSISASGLNSVDTIPFKQNKLVFSATESLTLTAGETCAILERVVHLCHKST